MKRKALTFEAARDIQQLTRKMGNGDRASISRKLKEILEELRSMVIAHVDEAVILAFVNQEIDKLIAKEVEIFDNLLSKAYQYSEMATLMAIAPDLIIQNSKIGYTSYWCKDGKSYLERVPYNLSTIKNELTGLLLGWSGDNPIVLVGLISDILTKAENQFIRLINTELEASYSQGARDAYLESGCYVAVIENPEPCDAICMDLVGEHEIDLREGVLGLDLPPYHPHCQCVFVGIFEQ